MRAGVFAMANLAALLQVTTIAIILWTSGEQLNPGDLFGQLALLIALQTTVATFAPMALEKLAELRVCDERLTRLMR